MSLDVNISEPDEFNSVELHSAIKSVAETTHFKDFSYHVDYLNGSGYIANIFRVILTENGGDKRVSVIVKTLVNTARKELFRELHNREVEAYTNVIDTFRRLQDDIVDENKLVLPICIYSSTDKGGEVLIFEDLLVSGFEVNDRLRKNKLEYSQVNLIFTELAKFHALSYVFKNNDGKLFNEVSSNFNDILFQESFLNKSKLRNYFTDSFEMSLNVVKDVETRKKLDIVKPKLLQIFRAYLKPMENSVFCHGDFWINNILFKKKDNKTELCFLDFQAMRYSSPVTDIIYFLYLCTDAQFRSQYLDDLLRDYYSSFESFLTQFGIEANEVYPQEDFIKNVEDNKVLGLLYALIELRIVAVPIEEDIPKESDAISETGSIKLFEEDNHLFQGRINDVVTECLENGVLQMLVNIALAIE